MTAPVEIVTTTKRTVALDMSLAADWFCELNDEQQADFFIEVARRSSRWVRDHTNQWWLVGRHLGTCDCSTEEARDMVKALHDGLYHNTISRGRPTSLDALDGNRVETLPRIAACDRRADVAHSDDPPGAALFMGDEQ